MADNLFTPLGTVPSPEAGDEIPAYLLAADNHNIGNQGSSWFDPTTWGERAGNALKFAATSILSGGSQLYNSGVTIANWFGADAQEEDTTRMISALDSDLGQYYAQNKDSADLVGFLVSSFAPGIGGVKVFNAGQKALRGALEGKVLGTNMSRAVGLLVPETEAYISASAAQINAASTTFSMINANTMKALASGAWQQALEAAAFETAVQATMFKSPILSEQDTGDIVKNIAIGAALGGVIGGALEGFSSYGKISKSVTANEIAGKFSTARGFQQELNNPAIDVIRMKQELESAAQVLPPVPGATAEEVQQYNILRQNATQRDTRTSLALRESMNKLAKGNDLNATNMMADVMTGMDSQAVMEGVLHADEITRASVRSAVETEQAALIKAGKSADESLQVNYVKLTGEGAGRVQDGEPLILSLADSVPIRGGKSLEDAVLEKVKEYGFSLKNVGKKLWDAGAKVGKTAHQEAEARYIWASKIEELPEELSVHMRDIPMIERAWELGKTNIKLIDDTGAAHINGFASRDEMWKYLIETKEEVASSLMAKRAFEGGEADEIVAEAAAKIVNTKVSRLDRTLIKGDFEDYRAWQTHNQEYNKFLEERKLPGAGEVDARFRPTYAKVSRRVADMTDANGHVMDGATWIATQGKLAQEAVNRVFTKAAGDLAAYVPEITEQQVWQASRRGSGASLFGFANGGYGTLESTVQAIGAVTNKLKQRFRSDTQTVLEGRLASLARNQEAAIEFSTINQKVTRSAAQWVKNPEGGLIKKEVLEKLNAGKIDIDEIPEDALIAIKNPETESLVDSLIGLSGKRTETYKELRAAQGHQDAKDPAVFRPIRPNPKDYPYFAFVKDPKVNGQGHTTMLFAADEAKLKQLADRAEQAGYRVHFKSDTEEFHKAYGDYEYSRTLNESYIDSDLKNRGIYSEHFTKTDPQKIANDILQQHLREDDVMAMELIRAKNQKAFDFLEDQGKAYTRVESSKFGGSIARVEASGKNPYLDYIKTALDISKASENNLVYSMNKALDGAVSKVVGQISDMWAASKTPYDAEKINSLLDTYGMNTGYRDAALDLLANHTAPKGELTKFVRAANGILSKLTLGLDPLNALNNAIGSNVLRGTELSQITRAIKGGDSELAGKLAELAKIDVTGQGDLILSPAKLMAQAIRNFMADGGKGPLTQRFKEAGYIKDITEQFHQILDDFTLKGTESVADLNSRLSRAFAKAKTITEAGEKFTGNKFAEEFNRFISADVMRQLTDLAESHKLLTREESHAYINTFVNRVEGNTIASQRPLAFQGPIGQAIGLFQSYQFNLMQQLFRYSAEGSKKDLAMLLGLQGTFYGINGLPGFQFINQHIVGTASGNKNHVDLYDATYGAAGKQMGNLLMYGLPSNLLQTNLYSRGDINPRQVTILPANVADVPVVGAFSKFLGSMKETLGKISGGGNVWESFLQGLEHNGISRPLAGMAQTLQAFGPQGQAYSTTNKGTILFSNDLLSLATLSRLAGGRPMDEAIVNDSVYRIHSYQQWNHDKMNKLAETVKTTAIAGNEPDEGAMVKFAKSYAEAGGKQGQFNKWMLNQMKNSNTSEASKIVTQLQNPFAQKVQVLMGGTNSLTNP